MGDTSNEPRYAARQVYRDGDDALRARVIAALAHREEALARLAHAAGGEVPDARDVDVDAPCVDLVTLSEQLERESRELEARAELLEARSTTSSPPAPPGKSVTRGAALARHGTLMSRLRRIAPLVDAARFARGERTTAPVLVRPARGASDEESVQLVTAQCDEAERELARLGLADVTGKPEHRARDVAKLRTIIAEARARHPALAPLDEAVARYAVAVREIAASPSRAATPGKPPDIPPIALMSMTDVLASVAALNGETARIQREAMSEPAEAARVELDSYAAPAGELSLAHVRLALSIAFVCIAGLLYTLHVVGGGALIVAAWLPFAIVGPFSRLGRRRRERRELLDGLEQRRAVRIATSDAPRALVEQNEDAPSETNRSARFR